MSVQEKAEENIIRLTGFSSENISNLREVFEDVYSVIHQYLEHSQGMNKRVKEEIVSISFQADKTKLELDKFIAKWNKMLFEIQKQIAEKKKVSNGSDELLEESEKIQKKVLKLIDKTHSFIKKVEGIGKAEKFY